MGRQDLLISFDRFMKAKVAAWTYASVIIYCETADTYLYTSYILYQLFSLQLTVIFRAVPNCSAL